MGKLTLLFVLAAILGGSVLAFSTRALAGLTARDQSEGQADLLARQIAESGQNLALTAMMGEDGFTDPALGTRSYDGGRFEVQYTAAADRQTATVTVRGYYGGAVHTVESAYEFDPMSYPGPIWLDVPYATSTAAGTPEVAGGPDRLPVRFDARMHAEMDLERDLPLRNVTNDFNPDVAAAGSAFSVPAASAWAPGGALLEDLNVEDAEGVYQAAVAAMTGSDQTLAGDQSVTTMKSWPGDTRITRVGGSLTVQPGGSVVGAGVLVVEGGLVVKAGGTLRWQGLVVVRAEQQVLPVTLSGTVDISGGLVVKQHALPPGGHLDVTVWRDVNGLTRPQGSHQVAPWNAGGPYPWTQHAHRFDQLRAGRQAVYFRENGSAGRDEAAVQFEEAIAAAGSTPVYLEFENEAEHGYARYTMNVQGEDDLSGTVRSGFPTGRHAAGQSHRSTPFPANRLRDFHVDVQSLRSLRDRFDDQGGCDQWPFCIGDDWSRGGALRVRLVRASDNRALHETALYWHMQAAERIEHEATMAAWRNQIAAGTGFGTHLTLGTDARVGFALAPIVRLADRLGFDGNEVILLNTQSSHQTAADARAAAATAVPPANMAMPATPPSAFPVTVCHVSNQSTQSAPNLTSYNAHRSHNDTIGACSTAPATPPPTLPTTTPPPTTTPTPDWAAIPGCRRANQLIKVCNKPPSQSSWNDYEMRCDAVPAYLIRYPNAVVGSCGETDVDD